MRIPFPELQALLSQKLEAHGFPTDQAALSARLFAETSLDGVYSHGVNRFVRYVQYTDWGLIKTDQRARGTWQNGSFEQWDGHRGPGNTNAWAVMEHAIALAREKGIACIGLRNTNHWMRGGTYGWQAAAAGCIAICWTNTRGNLPPWSSDRPLLGNNPLVVALPAPETDVENNRPTAQKPHLVLDMALSLFSYGKLEQAKRQGTSLAYDGGFGPNGELTRDPGAILETQRLLPTGLWKGAGLSLLLDLVGATLSGGLVTRQITALGERETGLSQTFLVIDTRQFPNAQAIRAEILASLEELRNTPSLDGGGHPLYPGERALAIRAANLIEGIPIDEEVWRAIQRC